MMIDDTATAAIVEVAAVVVVAAATVVGVDTAASTALVAVQIYGGNN